MVKEDLNIGGRVIKGVPHYIKDGKKMLAAEEVLEVEKILRRMKNEGIKEVEYREKRRG